MSFEASKKLEREDAMLVNSYPQKRCASLLVLHAFQEEAGY